MALKHIFLCLLLIICKLSYSQPNTYKENLKWGIKESETTIIPAQYDTIFNFDSTGTVCLACFKTKSESGSKYIKVTKISYSCNYLNRKNQRLIMRDVGGDTTSIFSLGKKSISEYMGNDNFFKVTSNGKKNLLTKDFKQKTFKGYQDIWFSEDPNYYVVQKLTEADRLTTGLIDADEKEIVPYAYSDITINPIDSLIICCSAGIRSNAADDVYNYKGILIESSYKHLVMATHEYLIQKIFEPKEFFVIYTRASKEEKKLQADEVRFYSEKEIVIKVKNHWYIYNLQSGEKRAKN